MSTTSSFAEGVVEFLDDVEYRRIDQADVDDPVFRLRYGAYRREGYLPSSDSGIYRDPIDGAPNAMVFGVYARRRLMGSIRVNRLTDDCRISASMEVFGDILGPMIDSGKTFIDPTRFTADTDASSGARELAYATLRLPLMAAQHFATFACLASVRPEHGAFYRRVFFSEPIGPQRTYAGLSFPIVLYSSPTSNLPRVFGRYPFFQSTEEERRRLFDDVGQFVRCSAREAMAT